MTAAELRRIVGAMTDRPWHARGQLLSRVRDSTGMGGTLHTNHIGNMADRDDSAAIATLANHADELVKLVEACEGLRAAWPEGGCVVTPPCGDCNWCRFAEALDAIHAIKETP